MKLKIAVADHRKIFCHTRSIHTVICIIMAFTEPLKLSIVHASLELTGFLLTVLTDSLGNLTKLLYQHCKEHTKGPNPIVQ